MFPVVAVILFCAVTSAPAVTLPAVADMLPVLAVMFPAATTFLPDINLHN